MNGRPWTDEEVNLVRELYPDTPTADLAQLIGRPSGGIYRCAQLLGLRKSQAYMESPAACRLRRGDDVGAPHRFTKGHVPANKGMRRPGWAPGRMKETQFKKGQRGSNWKPLGSERLIDGYRYTKVADTPNVAWMHNWKPTHVLLWEKHHGPIPKSHALVFLNRNRTDVRLENLELISRAELCRRNSVHNLPPELKKTIHTLGVLKRRIRKHEKQNRRSA